MIEMTCLEGPFSKVQWKAVDENNRDKVQHDDVVVGESRPLLTSCSCQQKLYAGLENLIPHSMILPMMVLERVIEGVGIN